MSAQALKSILVVHNRYRSGAPAGEDNAFQQEVELLRSAGHRVNTYERSNDEVSEGNALAVISTALDMRHSRRALQDLRHQIFKHKPDIAHFHNTFPLISVSGYQACREARVPVVQTLHNYRLLCSAAILYREGKPCHLCGPTSHRSAVLHSCYRSPMASLMVGSMLKRNWSRGIYQNGVDRYIALTEFSAQLFAQAGIARGRISVKANFLPFPPEPGQSPGNYVVWVGKLAEEKGLRTLLQAWRTLNSVPLKIVGAGPLDGELRDFAAAHALNVEFVGMCSRPQSIELIREASFLVLPSEWYEGFPLVVAEAYACGTPVIASRIGGLPELIHDGVTGLLFEPGNAASLAQAVGTLWDRRADLHEMQRACRSFFDAELTASRNLKTLLEIYDQTIAEYEADGHTEIAL